MAAITPAFPMTRGRRVALVLGVPVCLALIAYNGFDLVANFGEGKYAVSYALPAGAKSLTLSDAGGQVTIKQAPVSRATLTGTARYSLIRSTVTEHTAGGRTTIGNHCPLTLVGDCELDATVSVPVGLPVAASTGGGNASVTGATGPVTLSSGGGDLSADDVSGPLSLSTTGGNIQVNAITAHTLTASSGGGDITADGVSSATFTANTSGGNIQATVTSPRVTAGSGGGDIDIVFTTDPSNVRVSTSGGNITIVLPRDGTTYAVAATSAGGSVSEIPSNPNSPRAITATTGGGHISIIKQ
jgi:DUF4097 and DUF4098 domain-containing protein YvlB